MASAALRPAAGLVLALSLALGAPALAQSAGAPAATPDPRVVTVEIAGSIPAARPATIVLPKGYDAADGRRYPVLYLLHGHWGAHGDWLANSRLLAYTEDLPVIVVLPDAGDHWYANSVNRPEDRYEDYVGDDVVAYVDRRFRTLPVAAARYVAGLSMGGYGALKLALKRPGRFGLAASFSGAFLTATDTARASLDSVFGPVGGPARRSEDVATLIRGAASNPPYIYLDCGSSDRLLDSNRAVAAALAERQFAYEYHEVAGAHTWDYWNARLPFVLALVRERVRALPRGD